MIRIALLFVMIIPLQIFAAGIRKHQNIPYVNQDASYFDSKQHLLDVYYPRDTVVKKGVIIFFHGGSWNSGDKKSYKIMAKNFVRKGFIAVVVNYRMSPAVAIQAMAEDGAHAVDWVTKNISTYGGDQSRIMLAGHSAGGHLVALIYLQTMRKLNLENRVKKVLLIDPFGLDMATYFQEYHNEYARGLYKVFSDNPEGWRESSPVYYIERPVSAPFLILTGSKTYPAIIKSSQEFHAKIKAVGGQSDYQVIQGKKHIPMIIQFFFRHNKAYRRILPFLST